MRRGDAGFAWPPKSVDREFLVPDGAVGRAAGRLVLRCEQVFDLLVGAVEGSGLLGFFFARPPQLEGRFDEGRVVSVACSSNSRICGFMG